MKILFLSRLYWPHGGGVEKHVEMLSEQLVKQGHEITLITEQYDQNLPETDKRKGVIIYRIPYFAINSKLSLWTWIQKNMYLFDEAEIVHVHDVFWWYWPAWLSRLMKPVYITFHGYEGSQPPTKKAIIWRKTAELVCSGSICVGEFMRKWYFANPTTITYGAAKMETLPLVKEKSVVFLGRFEEDTGVLVYAEAMKRMKQIKKVSFYGKGTQEKLLKSLVETDSRFEIFSWTNDVSVAMKKGRFMLVSRYLGIIESMQAGKLVLAVYNNQIKRDYLLCHPMKDNMIIAADAQELVYKFGQILTSPEKEKSMIFRAKQWADEQSWGKMAGDYLDLWAR